MQNEQVQNEQVQSGQETAETAAVPESGEPAGEKKAPAPKHAAAKEFLEWVEMFSYSVIFVIVMFTFVFRIAVVHGPSMEKTLHEGQVLIVSDLFYEPKQGDIIVFQSNTIFDNEAIIKRVIATEGQTVELDLDNWTVYVDGVALDESYVNYMPGYSMIRENYTGPITVEKGKIYVMGDNRNQSTDSRDNRIGQVDKRFVLGRLLVRLFPLNLFGTVD